MQRTENLDGIVEQLRERLLDSAKRREALVRSFYADACLTALTTDGENAPEANAQANASSHDGFDAGPPPLSESPQMKTLQNIHMHELPALLARSAQLAERAQSCVSLATESSQRIRTLDTLLQRVRRTQAMTESMARMEDTVSFLAVAGGAEGGASPASTDDGSEQSHVTGPAAQTQQQVDNVDDEKLEQMVESIREYEAARRQLEGHSPSRGTSLSDAPTTPPSPARPVSRVAESAVVTSQKRSLAAVLVARVKAAVADEGRHDKVLYYCAMLAQLGARAAAGRLYSNHVCDKAVSNIKLFVDQELQRMLSPTEVTATHLSLVSRALDTLAAAYEQEEETTLAHFGPASGPLLLLQRLHERGTAECVPILRDFMAQRGGDALPRLSAATERRQVGGTSATGDEALDTRRVDMLLEEMGHLVACCHLYFSFVEKRSDKYGKMAKEEKQVADAATTPAEEVAEQALLSTSAVNGASGENDALAAASPDKLLSWVPNSSENPLMSSVQEILGLYIPLQQRYFALAFDQALSLQEEAMRGALRRQTEQQLQSGGAGGAAVLGAAERYAQTNAAIFNSIAKYLTEEDDDEEGDAEDKLGFIYFSPPENGTISLIDDVFFFLRVAVQRALNTQSTQIVSAVLLSIAESIQDRLIPHVERKVCGAASLGAGAAAEAEADRALQARQRRWRENRLLAPPPQVLRWCQAGAQTVVYMVKLSEEVRRFSRSSRAFTPRDVTRFTELTQDVLTCASDFSALARRKWCERLIAAFVFDNAIQPYLTQLARNGAYNITQDDEYQLDMYQSWAQTLSVECEQVFAFLRFHLDGAAARSLLSPTVGVSGDGAEGTGSGSAGAAFDPFDVVLNSVAHSTCVSIKRILLQQKGGVSVYGAFRMEKEVRQVQDLFLSHSGEITTTLRTAFAPLMLLLSLWMCDRPSDALEESHNTALTPAEKREALLCRIDFDQEEVAKLPL